MKKTIFIAVVCFERNVSILGIKDDPKEALELMRADIKDSFGVTDDELDNLSKYHELNIFDLLYDPDEMTACGKQHGNNYNWSVFEEQIDV